MRIFDLHCDTVCACTHTGQTLDENDLCVSVAGGKRFERWVQTFAVFVHDRYRGAAATAEFDAQYSFLNAELRRLNIPHFAGEQTGCAVLKSVENLSFLGDDFARLADLRRDGVRLATLTWNAENVYGGGASSDCGLTPLGRAAAKRMTALGVTPDVSHLSDRSFYDLLETVSAPVIASHSNARAICPHRRNLTDEMLRCIAERGGLVGLNFYTEFLSPHDACRADILRHAEHILRICGETVPAIGSDFDGAQMPDDLKTQEDIEKLYADMVQYFGTRIADRIFYRNAAEFFSE